MLATKIEFMGALVHLETDDPDLVQRFERDCKWDHPLLKFKKEKKTDGKGNQKHPR